MTSAKELLNEISDFTCTVDAQKIVFPGLLQEENGNIILNAKFPSDKYRKIISNDFVVLGNVSKTEVTLIGCHISSFSYLLGSDYGSIHVIPNEIIVGRCFPSMPMAKKVTISTPDLNYMFFGKPLLEENTVFSKENPSVLNYTFPEPITATDKYGNLKLYQIYNNVLSTNSFTYNFISVIEYSFTSTMLLMDAIAKVSVARNLFSFFGNRYISYGKITFKIDDDENEYMLWLNYEENIPAIDSPFLITTSAFENQFQQIWDNWLGLYEKANPINTLFYEIICDHSTRVNCFLNLAQAIEVYSTEYRDEYAKIIFKKDPNYTGKDVTLKHRIQDIIIHYNLDFELNTEKLDKYAAGLSDMRNYYTHYSNSRKFRVEPSYDELFSAIHILKFVLLTIVYTTVGISHEQIIECKKRIIFRSFGSDAETILQYNSKTKNANKKAPPIAE
jgi:hypothetical protein